MSGQIAHRLSPNIVVIAPKDDASALVERGPVGVPHAVGATHGSDVDAAGQENPASLTVLLTLRNENPRRRALGKSIHPHQRARLSPALELPMIAVECLRDDL